MSRRLAGRARRLDPHVIQLRSRRAESRGLRQSQANVLTPPFTPSGVEGRAELRASRTASPRARLAASALMVEVTAGGRAQCSSPTAPRPSGLGHRLGESLRKGLVGPRGPRGAGREEQCGSAHVSQIALLVKILSSGRQILHHTRTFTKLRLLPTSGVGPRGSPRRAPRTRPFHHRHPQSPARMSAGQGRGPGTRGATAPAERGSRPWRPGLHGYSARGALPPRSEGVLTREPLGVNEGARLSARLGAACAPERAP